MTITYERRYFPAGKVTHLLGAHDWSGAQVPHALCGLWAWKVYWRGTGSQDEYDRAAALPICKSCLRKTEQ